MRAFLAIVLAIFCVSCSKADADKTSADLKQAAANIKNDPAVKDVAADVKEAAKDAKVEIQKGAAKAKVELKEAGSDVKSAAKDAKADAKKATS